ncbi:Mannitol dehydrogenase (Fragment) [Seminavis robusta]|uniref:Mannitol dehydrogenase n=1 Tax=Seminavis robusta TaxID=568900 RepID=A0A9N8EI37_9STRA
MATIKDGKGTLALAAFDTNAKLEKHEFGRPAPGPNDVNIDIQYCGMCHSDLHACNGDWGLNAFPIAPGHEIAGVVKSVGADVKDLKVGDKVGVGCFVEACFSCGLCEQGEQNLCRECVQTYGNPYPKGKGHDECAGYHTNGGYSTSITVRSDFVFKVPEGISMEYVGPLLCAGITMFSPLNRHILMKEGEKPKSIGIVGFGGLGQMGVKLAKAMGCEVTVLSRSTSKKDEAAKLGAEILAHSDEEAMKAAAYSFDVILDTVSAHHEIAPMMTTLKVGGTYVCIGAFGQTFGISPIGLIFNHHKIEGSLVGGIPETQKMLEFCSEHNILPEIKVIAAKDATDQFKALADGSAGALRAVIDMSTLSDLPARA